MIKLIIRDVAVHYGDKLALSVPALTLQSGRLIALVGPNGAGKSTLLKSLAGVIDHRGEIQIDGQDISALAPRLRAQQIGYLPQGREVHWALSVRDVVALGRLPHQDGFVQSPDDVAAIDEAMTMTETSDFASRSSQSLSGGELARVLLARALALQSPILLCDEPTASLDPYHQHAIMQTLRQRSAAGALVVVVLHDLNLAIQYSDEVVLITQGRCTAHGTPSAVLTPENIQKIFGVLSHSSAHEDRPYVITLPCKNTTTNGDES